jgi:DNA-binding CsgD family transcriptional regulator
MPRLTHEDWIQMNALALAIHAAPHQEALKATLLGRLPDLLGQPCRLDPVDQPENDLPSPLIRLGLFHLRVTQSPAARETTLLNLLTEHIHLAWEKLSTAHLSPRTRNTQTENILSHPGFAQLSQRPQEVLPHLLRGLSNDEIASELGISSRTVEKHVTAVLRAYGCVSRAQLLAGELNPNQQRKKGKVQT